MDVIQVILMNILLINLYKLFLDKDASMIEINPMIEDSNGQVLCIDAKCRFDDNAEFRQKDIYEQKDTTQIDVREVEARAANLNYISLIFLKNCHEELLVLVFIK